MRVCTGVAAVVAGLMACGFLAPYAEGGEKEDAKQFLKLLEGKWQMTSYLVNGKAEPKQNIKKDTITFKGDKYTHYFYGKPVAEASYKINAAKTPTNLLLTYTEGHIVKGIIKVEGDTLTMCWMIHDSLPRPKDFKPGDKRFLGVYKRVK